MPERILPEGILAERILAFIIRIGQGEKPFMRDRAKPWTTLGIVWLAVLLVLAGCGQKPEEGGGTIE
ncbi:MAG: hypothetical protein BAA02_13785 [Paenibacillaceae bacterium ZCTH02-B3]|nr:MAG: hypothetical protein BAA02_13785 [Paenibacillaceae bacterium ZCTH02-B3]